MKPIVCVEHTWPDGTFSYTQYTPIQVPSRVNARKVTEFSRSFKCSDGFDFCPVKEPYGQGACNPTCDSYEIEFDDEHVDAHGWCTESWCIKSVWGMREILNDYVYNKTRTVEARYRYLVFEKKD